MRVEDLRPKAVELSLALRAGKTELALDLLEKLLVLQTKPEVTKELMAVLRNVLGTAARQRDKTLFLKLLERCREPLLQLSEQEEAQEEFLELLNALLFEVCDKKIVGSGTVLQQLCKAFYKHANRGMKEAWCVETLSLAARILRRGWVEVGQWLLRRVLKLVCKEQDIQLLQRLMPRIELHMVQACRYDGLEKTIQAYLPIQGLYLWLLKQAEQKDGHLGQAELVLALRSLREWITNSATAQMQEELELYEAWNQVLLEQVGAGGKEADDAVINKAGKTLQRRRQLLQLAILYWNRTKPKSSRKQVRYLQELLEPDVISPKLKKLLERV